MKLVKAVIKRVIGRSNFDYLKDYLSKEDQNGLDKRINFYSSFLQDGGLYFDIGANYGNRITPALKIGAKVVAVEPQNRCVKFLKKKFGQKIQIVQKGVDAQEGTKTFFVSTVNTLSSFSAEWIDAVKTSGRFKEFQWKKKDAVEMTTLDSLIEKFGIPQFIKIDVEGYELQVLKGLSHPIACISYEYTVPEQTERVVDCLARIYEVNKNIECNYSVGESMDLAMSTWISYESMHALVISLEFINSQFGDIYIRSVKNCK